MTLTSQWADVALRDDGILTYDYHPGAVIDLEAARAVVALGAELVGDTPRPSLIRIGEVKGLSRQARQFFATGPENHAVSSHVALLIGSPVARVIGNFYLGLNKPDVPTRLFTVEAEALAWLREMQRF